MTSASTEAMRFCCQRCGHGLQLHPSLQQGVSAEAEEELTGLPKQGLRKIEAPIADLVIPEGDWNRTQFYGKHRSLEASFALVHSEEDEAEGGKDESEARTNLEVMAQLFDVMSGRTEVDHPLCENCTDILLDELDEQLKTTEAECKDYRELLERLSVADCSASEERQLQAELQQLKSDEEHLRQQLEQTAVERSELVAAIEEEKGKFRLVEQQHENFQKQYNHFKYELHNLEDEYTSVENQAKYAGQHLSKLKKTNIFNTTFHIWHQGHFGTINGFRLGRMPGVPVDWSEINAAWGQTVLLLHALCAKMDLTLQRYRLVPMGNHSYLESLQDKGKELPLYGYGGIKFFWDAKFDQAMVAFLDCLQQFKEAVERGDSGFSLPYKMEKGKIIDSATGTTLSIKVQFSSEEQWTKALKFMLTNLKWGLAWVASQFAHK